MRTGGGAQPRRRGGLCGIRPSSAVLIDVTVPAGRRRRHTDLCVHTARRLEVTTLHGIPVTTPARTILDRAAVLQRRPLERLLDNAEAARLTDVGSLDAPARAHAGHRGAKRLRDALTTHTPGTTLTRSELEERFLARCAAAGVDRPLVNHHAEGHERDFVFAEHRLVVETDGWRHHRTRDAFEDDRCRDAILLAAGWRTLRLTHRRIADRPEDVVATLRAVLVTGPIAA